MKMKNGCKHFFMTVAMIALLTLLVPLSVAASDGETDEGMPKEYGGFLDSLPDSVIEQLPDGICSENREEVSAAAGQISSPTYFLHLLFDSFGASLGDMMPTLTVLCGVVILSAVAYTVASHFGAGTAKAIELCAGLCAFGAISGLAITSLSRLQTYFSSLFSTVAAFLPLSGVLYAMGGNLTAAASTSASLSVILTVAQFVCSYTVLPFFGVCLSLSLLSALDGVGSLSGASVSGLVKKWYTTALGFVMMLLTTSLGAQSLLAAKADGAAMRGAKFAVSGFVPITGGTVSSTLGTLVASVELLRGAVGVIGVVILLLMLIPVIVELAVVRGILGIAAFVAGMLGCGREQRLLSEIGSLYGYLEGVAALCSVIFIIAMSLLAITAAAV